MFCLLIDILIKVISKCRIFIRILQISVKCDYGKLVHGMNQVVSVDARKKSLSVFLERVTINHVGFLNKRQAHE